MPTLVFEILVSIACLTIGQLSDVDPIAILRGVESTREVSPPGKFVYSSDFRASTVRNRFKIEVQFNEDRRNFRMFESPDGLNVITCFDGGQQIKNDGDGNVTLQAPSTMDGSHNFDPRILGINSAYRPSATIGSSLSYRNAKTVEFLGVERIAEQVCWHVSLVDQYDQIKDFWVTNDGTFRVLKFVQQNTPDSKRVTTSVYDTDSPFPFPSEVYSEEIRNGGVSRSRRVQLLKTEEVVPDEALFTLSGVEPAIGSSVVDLRIHQMLGYWNGKSISPNPIPKDALEPVSSNTSRRYYIGASFLLCAASFSAFFIFRWWRRRGESETVST